MGKIRILSTGFLVCLLALPCCSGVKTSEIVIAKTVFELTQVKSYQLDTDFIDKFNSSEYKGTKIVDISDKEMESNMAIIMGLSPAINVSDEMYFMSGVDYSETISEENTPQTIGWTKTQLTDDSWNQQTQLPILAELLKSTTKYSSLEIAQLNNIDYYVLTVIPSAQASVDFVLSQEQPGGPSYDTGGIDHTLVGTDTYKSGSVELWINQNSYLPIKVEVKVDFRGSLLGGFVTVTPNISNIVDWSFQGDLDFSNYNQPVSIQVPQAALNAQ